MGERRGPLSTGCREPGAHVTDATGRVRPASGPLYTLLGPCRLARTRKGGHDCDI